MEWVDRVFLDHRDHDDLAGSQGIPVQKCLCLVQSPGESNLLEMLGLQLS